MAKSRIFHWGLFLSPPIDSIAYRERHSCCCLFVCSKQQLKGSVCVSFSSVLVHCELSPRWIGWKYFIQSAPWSGPAPIRLPPKKSNNNHNNAKEILTGGLSHHLFACHAQQLQNVYNRRSVIFLWGVFFFLSFSTVVYHFLPISCVCVSWVARKEGAADVWRRDGSQKVPVDEEPPVKPKQQQQQQQLLSLSQMLERGRRLHSLRLWVASFRKPPPIFRCCH